MYGSTARMEQLFGLQELAGLVPSDSDDYDRGAVTAALTDASSEVNSYLAYRYPNPLPNVPATVERATCDIARYFLYKDRPTDQVAQRYKEVTAWLTNVSKGVVALVFDPIPVPAIPVGGDSLEQNPNVGLPFDTCSVFSDRRLAAMPDIRGLSEYLPFPSSLIRR